MAANVKLLALAASTRVRCGFFLKRKNRYCKMIPGKGKKYCGEHSYLCEENEKCSDRKRIPCPLDTNHTVFQDQLEKHLKKCNVTKKRQVEYYQANINSGLTKISEEECKTAKLPLKMISKSDIQACIDMIKSYFTADNMLEISTSISTDKNLEEEIGKIDTNPTLKKHLHQQSSLIGNMRESGLLTPNNVFVEFGAGRGLLSHWVQRSIKGESNVEFLLVDRASTRYKADSYHRGTDQGPSFNRIQIDIEHLDLRKVPLISKSNQGITGISKHLCGAATDLALRCLLCPSCDNQMTNNDGDTPRNNTSCDSSAKRIKLDNNRIKGLLFALCCHHCCSWTSYVGKEFLEKLGFTPYYFHILCCLTSWATCGSRDNSVVSDTGNQTQTIKSTSETESHSETSELQQEDREVVYEESSIRALGFSKSESEEIGRQSKRLLDAGRVSYLKEHGFKASLVYYVERSVSLENVALIAWNT